jgi:hypothetical protein
VSPRARLILSVSSVIFLCQTPLLAQGFGGLVGLKKARTVTLKRLLPATVNLNQKRIKIVAVGETKIPADLPKILTTKLITSIQKDNRFIVDDKNPETELHFTITNYYVESRILQVPGATPPQNCTVFTGKIEASYQAIEMRTGAPLDSENLKYAITVEEPKGVPMWKKIGPRQGNCGTNAKATENEARDELADAIDAQMAQRAAPTEESVLVQLPGGKLEPLSAMAMSQRWGSVLEGAEKMDKFPKPEDDAYRIYLIALANEALAYEKARESAELEKARGSDVSSDKAKRSMDQEEKNFTEAQAYLDQATKSYKDAIQAKPGEKEFREPDARMENAVRLYQTIARHKEEYQEAVKQKDSDKRKLISNAGSSSAGSGGPRDVTSSSQISAYNQVIAMCKDHVSGIDGLIKEHPDEIHFLKGLSLAEDLELKRECGTDAPAIATAIKSQLGKKLP